MFGGVDDNDMENRNMNPNHQYPPPGNQQYGFNYPFNMPVGFQYPHNPYGGHAFGLQHGYGNNPLPNNLPLNQRVPDYLPQNHPPPNWHPPNINNPAPNPLLQTLLLQTLLLGT